MSPSTVWKLGLVPKEKPCLKCGVVKALAHFSNHGFSADGKQSVCSWCMRIQGWRARGVLGEFPSVQPDRCDACGHVSTRLHMDHCHQTGYFRGFLCPSCNMGLGHIGDTAAAVAKVLAYVQSAEDRISAHLATPPDLGEKGG